MQRLPRRCQCRVAATKIKCFSRNPVSPRNRVSHWLATDENNVMPLYFYVLDNADFRARLRPALTQSRRVHSFAPCQTLCRELIPVEQRFHERYHLGPDEILIPRIARGLPFDRHVWRLLVAEMLMVCAVEMPPMQTAFETLAHLLHAPAPATLDRPAAAPIEQAHFGSRDLVFGAAWYRPEHVGWND